MYRKLSRRQQEARARKLEAMRRGKDRARMARPAPGRAPDLPEIGVGAAAAFEPECDAAPLCAGHKVKAGSLKARNK